ncbi:MAG: protein-disulfide reductase DsbD domain-containing protein [Janthinobacterium lividum]
MGFCLGLCTLTLPAQTALVGPTSKLGVGAPVRWSAEPLARPVPVGARFQVVLHAAIDPGWHLYALQQPEGGPMPTEIALQQDAPADLLRVDQEKPRRVADPQFHLLTAYFVQAARFTLRLQANGSVVPGAHPLHVLVRYQACNDRMCLPPHEDSLTVAVQMTR